MKTLSIVFSLLICMKCVGQIYDQKRFNHIVTSNQDEQFQKALINPPATDFAVSATNGLLKIHTSRSLPIKKYAYKFGALLAINFGEAGGGLFYQPFFNNNDDKKNKIVVDGKQVTADNRLGNFQFLLKDNDPAWSWLHGPDFLLFDNNVADLITDTAGYIFFTNNRQLDKGGLFRLVAQKETFTISQLIKFDETAPLAMNLSNNKIYLVTTRGFYIVSNSTGKIELELNTIFKSRSYPNSIAVLSETEIYIGMRSAYARINPQTKQVDFFLYQY